MGLISEFKEFALKGNAVDLAVGVVIGAAFGKIVSSLVNDIIMPPIGLLTGGLDFSQHKLILRHNGTWDAAKQVWSIPPTTINYGVFINNAIDFLIVAAAIFMVIKLMNTAMRKHKEDVAPPATKEETLLTEIRDAIRAKG